MRYLKSVEKECVLCGSKYLTTARNTLYCVECRTRKAKQRVRENYLKQKLKTEKRSRKKPAAKSLPEVMADLAAYNKEHGTHLSYGEYVVIANV